MTEQAEHLDELEHESKSRISELDGDRLRASSISAFGWIAATVLALNAGGLATSLSLLDRLANPFGTAAFFLVGVLMLVGSGGSFATGAGLHVVALDRHEDGKDSRVGSIDPLSAGDFLMAASGLLVFLALASFLLGCAFGYSGFKIDRANEMRCLAIQRDMLSAQPRRSDGPDLFQALGCKPQGEGSVYATPRG